MLSICALSHIDSKEEHEGETGKFLKVITQSQSAKIYTYGIYKFALNVGFIT